MDLSSSLITHFIQPSMDMQFAQTFARQWVAAWNAHDLDAVLVHYTEDFSILTPIAAQMVPGSGGLLRGKAAIRDYWAFALTKIPELEFELIDVLTGVGALAIYYLNTATGRKAAEVLRFNDADLVSEAIVCYS